MRHVLVCTTGYGDHWAGTIARKKAKTQAMSDDERARARPTPEEHADGHKGPHCGEHGGGNLYELFKEKLAAAGITDVVLSPNACIAQHVAGCMVMVYPDGIWYAVHSPEAVDRIVDEHLLGGRPVEELVHRRLRATDGRGLGCMLEQQAAGS